MNLKDDKQQNIQMQLDFSLALTGEAREAGREGTESPGARNGTENPASTNRLMEEVCERENLKAALQRVKANKGSPGGDAGSEAVGPDVFRIQLRVPAGTVGSASGGTGAAVHRRGPRLVR